MYSNSSRTSKSNGRTFEQIQESSNWVKNYCKSICDYNEKTNVCLIFSVVDLEYVDTRALQNRIPYTN